MPKTVKLSTPLAALSSPAVAPPIAFDPLIVINDLQWMITECNERCIVDGVKWASEILAYIPHASLRLVEEKQDKMRRASTEQSIATQLSEANRFQVLGRSLLYAKDFSRAEFFLKKAMSVSSRHMFLYFWSRYLRATHMNLENDSESVERKAADKDDDSMMAMLYEDLCKQRHQQQGKPDVFLLYLYGKVQRSLLMVDEAKETFLAAQRADPRMWLVYEELAELVADYDEMNDVKARALGKWYGEWFEAKTLPRFQQHALAVEKTEELQNRGLGQQPILMEHRAFLHNQIHEHDPAIEIFSRLHQMEPFRVEKMNLYSDSLYIRGMRTQLAGLAHHFFRTHKFRYETCCIVSNYYSIRGDHDQAIRFLHRSLRLNPFSASTWTLIGHEFMELKNNAAACMSYRKAIEIDPDDHRGWYGLGQLYDILKMNSYALFYYQEAHKCKPSDSRMLVALGEVYTKMNKTDLAEKCFLKAFKVGDVEGVALFLLAKLYEGCNQLEQAATVYEKYLNVYADSKIEDDNVPPALRFLARHYLDKSDYDAANTYAQRCIEFDSVREEGRAVLRQIAAKWNYRSTRSTPRGVQTRSSTTTDVTPLNAQQRIVNLAAADDSQEMEMAISDGEDVSFG